MINIRVLVYSFISIVAASASEISHTYQITGKARSQSYYLAVSDQDKSVHEMKIACFRLTPMEQKIYLRFLIKENGDTLYDKSQIYAGAKECADAEKYVGTASTSQPIQIKNAGSALGGFFTCGVKLERASGTQLKQPYTYGSIEEYLKDSKSYNFQPSDFENNFRIRFLSSCLQGTVPTKKH